VGVPLREKLRVRLYTAIFVFLKKKHKGFPLPSFTQAVQLPIAKIVR
jgi:hypothetical protein